VSIGKFFKPTWKYPYPKQNSLFFMGADSKSFSFIAENGNHINFHRNAQAFDWYWPLGNIKRRLRFAVCSVSGQRVSWE